VREDRALLRRLGRGDQDALRLIYQKFKDDLITVAFCLLGDLAAAEDCLHDVFVNFAFRARNLRLRSNLKGYLTTCVANRARDLLRAGVRLVSLDGLEQVLPAKGNPSQETSDREETARLVRAMLQLPREQREVITMHLYGRLKFRQIAEQFAMSINTVQSRYRYGIDKLRKLLDAGEAR